MEEKHHHFQKSYSKANEAIKKIHDQKKLEQERINKQREENTIISSRIDETLKQSSSLLEIEGLTIEEKVNHLNNIKLQYSNVRRQIDVQLKEVSAELKADERVERRATETDRAFVSA